MPRRGRRSRASSASSALAKLPTPSRLRRLSMPASGSGTPRAIGVASARAKLPFDARPVHQRQAQHGRRGMPVSRATSASARSASHLLARVIVARVRRIAFAKRPSRRRRFAVDLDRAREHEVRDARRRRGARERVRSTSTLIGAERRQRIARRVSRIACARPARCTTACAPRSALRSACVGDRGRDRRPAACPARAAVARRQRAHQAAHRHAGGAQVRAHGAADEAVGAGDDDGTRSSARVPLRTTSSRAGGRSAGRSSRNSRCAASPCAPRAAVVADLHRRHVRGLGDAVQAHAPVEVLEVEEVLRIEAAGAGRWRRA